MSKFNELINSHPVVLVDFYADWCGPCKAMAPQLEQLKEEYGDQIKIVKINTEKNQSLSAQFGIRSIPTLHLYKNGEQVYNQAGAMMLPQLKQLTEKYI